jgi:hypothetical protein
MPRLPAVTVHVFPKVERLKASEPFWAIADVADSNMQPVTIKTATTLKKREFFM